MDEELVEENVIPRSRIEKIKEHIKRHKVAYSVGVTAVITGITIAGITYAIMRRDQSLGGRLYDQWSGADVDTTKPQAIISSPFSNSFNTTTNHNYIQPMSKIVYDPVNDRHWLSQAECALDLSVSEADLSKHLNHDKHLPNPYKDLKLTRMGYVVG